MAPIQEYVGTLIYVGVALFIGVAALLVGALLGPKKPGRAKLMPYESGNDPAGEVKRFPVHFYVVAMLFILFDVEVAFLWPYAVSAGGMFHNYRSEERGVRHDRFVECRSQWWQEH